MIRRAAEDQPGYLGLRYDSSLIHIQIGDSHRALGEAYSARAAREESPSLSRGLVAAVSSNIGWRRSLWIAHQMLGELASDDGDPVAGTTHFNQTLREMVSARLIAHDESARRSSIKARLAELGSL